MAGMKEMALGIATTLRSGMAPNPLPIAFWGYAPEDAAQLAKYIINECSDAGIELAELRADPVVVHQLTGSRTDVGASHCDVPVTADPNLHGQLHIFLADCSPA